jgi:hypothetical protein
LTAFNKAIHISNDRAAVAALIVALIDEMCCGFADLTTCHQKSQRLTVILKQPLARVLRSDWLMTFFDNQPSHGHDVSSFGAMRRNAICCLREKQEIARRIEIFRAPLFDERRQNDKTRIVTCPP